MRCLVVCFNMLDLGLFQVECTQVFGSSNLQNSVFFLMCLYRPFEVTGTTPVLQMSQLRK